MLTCVGGGREGVPFFYFELPLLLGQSLDSHLLIENKTKKPN